MKQVILVCMLLFVTGCVQVGEESSSFISERDVIEALQKHQIELTKGTSIKEKIFASKLRGVKPQLYELNEKLFVLYEFETLKELEKGVKDFASKTASMNVVSYETFIKGNILIFYVHEEPLNSNHNSHFANEIQAALDSLIIK